MREWLKNLRTEKNLTMKDLGRKLGISESYYCEIENGNRQKKMDVTLIAGLSNALNIPMAVIVQKESEYRSCKLPISSLSDASAS